MVRHEYARGSNKSTAIKPTSKQRTAQARVERRQSGAVIFIAGDWLLNEPVPHVDDLALDDLGDGGKLSFESTELGNWDSALTVFLMQLHLNAVAKRFQIDDSSLPEGAKRLLRLALTVGEPEGARRASEPTGWLEQIGISVLGILKLGSELLSFVGELVLSLRRLLSGRAALQKADVMVAIQEAGAEAFPIVSLICFLIGMIFAFVGVMQLEAFGAGIYTADLVAVGMVREMAPIMTGIIMAGRTGAGYAAHIGTMKANEEIDALTTLGINPIDFLVLPRVIALVVMMPMLTLYGSLMGIFGGAVVGLSMLDVSILQYAVQTQNGVGLNSLFGGLLKAIVYGFLIAIAGCQQGISCGNSAMAVGKATTHAVVNGIVLIVISASLLTIIYINLEI